MWGARSSSKDKLVALQRGRAHHRVHNGDYVQDLALRLREAAAWCATRADSASPRAPLAPKRLAPPTLTRDRSSALDDVCDERSRDLRTQSVREEQLPARGRLLIYFPDAELSDGAAQVESREFFDVFNAPPWGTWVAYFEESSRGVSQNAYLLAWVPAELVPLASAGIEVNPEECIAWLEDTTVEIRDIVRTLLGDLREWLTIC